MRLLLINPAERQMVQANLPQEIEAVRGVNFVRISIRWIGQKRQATVVPFRLIVSHHSFQIRDGEFEFETIFAIGNRIEFDFSAISQWGAR